jgi:hypothetical protein
METLLLEPLQGRSTRGDALPKVGPGHLKFFLKLNSSEKVRISDVLLLILTARFLTVAEPLQKKAIAQLGTLLRVHSGIYTIADHRLRLIIASNYCWQPLPIKKVTIV